jgi:hypothetical protein
VSEIEELESCLAKEKLGEIASIFSSPESPLVKFKEMADDKQAAQEIEILWMQVVHVAIKVVPILWTVDNTTDYSTLWNDLEELRQKFQELRRYESCG